MGSYPEFPDSSMPSNSMGTEWSDSTMNINIPRNIRLVLYIVTVFGSLLVTYFATTGKLGGAEVALWSGFTAAVAAMAGFNLTPPEQEG